MSPVDEPASVETGQPSGQRRFLRNRWELLVVITVVAIILALLFPAIEIASEGSRRMRCNNNLKQIGLAIHDYTTAQKIFPPGTICTMKPKMMGQWDVLTEAAQTGPGFQGTGFLLRILPYIEGDKIAGDWKWSVGISNSDSPKCNISLAMTNIPGFYCPTRRHRVRSGDAAMMLSPSWAGGGTDYGGCVGRHAAFTPQTGHNYCDATTFYEPNFLPILDDGKQTVRVETTQLNRNGIFGAVNESTTFGQIRDGTSNTIMTGELQRITDVAPGSKDGWAIGGPATLFTNGAMYRRLGAKSVPASPSDGRMMNNGFFGAPGSDHAGGANIGTADGAVRFMSDTMDPNVFALLGSMADNPPFCPCDPKFDRD